jgi:hypothetical protein
VSNFVQARQQRTLCRTLPCADPIKERPVAFTSKTIWLTNAIFFAYCSVAYYIALKDTSIPHRACASSPVWIFALSSLRWFIQPHNEGATCPTTLPALVATPKPDSVAASVVLSDRFRFLLRRTVLQSPPLGHSRRKVGNLSKSESAMVSLSVLTYPIGMPEESERRHFFKPERPQM